MSDSEKEKRREDSEGRTFKGRGAKAGESKETELDYTGKGAIFDKLDGGGGGPIKSVEGWIVFVRNVHDEASEEELKDKFSDFGELKNLHMPLDRRTGFVKGYALIEYETKAEAEEAIKQANGSTFMDKILLVDWAFSRPQKNRRSSGRRR
eukprot:TRINITY_DN14415_c0_g1_i1.p1 TRINITY_DN14415_c0_g1~~TRINITY_DN14415_c0_g1_i1.p1  ORF type:complete len:151 (+),score=40.97 TRINITY_DN14415_c0_g1_i1:151-603(+)